MKTLWFVFAASCLGLVVSCGDKPAAPLAPSPAAPATTPATPVPAVVVTVTAPKAQSPVNSFQMPDDDRAVLVVTNAKATGTTDELKYRYQWSELDSFPQNSYTGSKDGIVQGSGDTTSYKIPDYLRDGFKYYWRAQAYTAAATSDWSPVESFVTMKAVVTVPVATTHCSAIPDIVDPLTDGKSDCASSILGGRFIPGQGWQAINDSDGINYDITTCSSCTVEFDVTNFGRKEGEAVQKDLKWFSMGDATTYNDFIAFRNHPWKMHLEQRSDGDGSGMKMIFRNGDAGDGEPGDHTGKVDPAVNWTSTTVYHFIISWRGGSGFTVQVGEKQPNGSVTGLTTWFQDNFGGYPYAPPNHRIQLGCSPRQETMNGSAIWRNVRIYRN